MNLYTNSINDRKISNLHISVYFLFVCLAVFSLYQTNTFEGSNQLNFETIESSNRGLFLLFKSLTKNSTLISNEIPNSSLDKAFSTQSGNYGFKRHYKEINNYFYSQKQEKLPIRSLESYSNFFDIINSKIYKGKWISRKTPLNFQYSEGLLELKFIQQILSMNFRKNILRFTIRDGYYFENYLEFDIEFDSRINPLINTNVILTLNSVLLDIKGWNYFTEKFYQICQCNAVIDFKDLTSNRSRFDLINGTLVPSKCEFEKVDFMLKPSQDETISKSITFSKFLLIIGLLSLLSSFILFKKLTLFEEIAIKFSLELIASNVIWNTYMCICCIYASIQQEINLYYLLSFLVFFIDSAIFQLRTMIIVWRSNHQEIINNYNELKKRMLMFYLIFYSFLVVFLYHSTYIFTNNYLMFFVVCSLWIPQIIKSAKIGRCALQTHTILIISLNRTFVFFYFKLCPSNFLNMETFPCFSYICLFIIFLSVIMLFLQKLFGTRFLLPKFYRPITFDYYDVRKLMEHEKNQLESIVCPICIMNISSSNSFQSEQFFPNSEKTSKIYKISSYLKRCIKNNNKDIMLTPCNHLFHSKCLITWYERKKDCPVCRLTLPLMEE